MYISERECRKFEEGYNSKVAYKTFGKNVEFKKYDSCLSQLQSQSLAGDPGDITENN